MAKFISILVTNPGLPLTSGIRLINADLILSVQTVSSVETRILFSTATTSFDTLVITHVSTGNNPSVKDAINTSITVVPGGQVVAVVLPSGITVSSVESV